MPTARHRTATAFRQDRPPVHGHPGADAPPPQCINSDLARDTPVGEAELTAIERLLGEDLAGFFAALN
jgi:hypothetical protein